MLRRAQFHSTAFLVAAAVAAGAMALSCGGGPERDTVAGPAPAVAQAPASDQGTVGASATPDKVTICHYDATTGNISDITVPVKAVAGHLKHGDYDGTCAAACPCFAAGIQEATCTGGLGESCGYPYYLIKASANNQQACSAYYVAGENPDGTYYCQGLTGTTSPISPAQFEACKAILVPILILYHFPTCS